MQITLLDLECVLEFLEHNNDSWCYDTPRDHQNKFCRSANDCAKNAQSPNNAKHVHSPWTAPKPRKRNRINHYTLDYVVAEALVDRESTPSPAARELQPVFAEHSDTSTENSPLCGLDRSRRVLQQIELPNSSVRGNSCRLPSPRLHAIWSIQGSADAGDPADATMWAGNQYDDVVVASSRPPASCPSTFNLHDSSSSLFPSNSCHFSCTETALPTPAQEGAYDCSQTGERPCKRRSPSPPACMSRTQKLYSSGYAVQADECFHINTCLPSPSSPGAAASDIDELNSLLRQMCRVSEQTNPQDVVDWVREHCKDRQLQGNDITVRYLNDLYIKYEQLH